MVQTAPAFRPVAAMLVDLAPDVAAACTTALASLGYAVVNVAHVPAACERLPVVMPRVLIASADAAARDREDLRDRAVAVGAQMLWFPRDADAAFVTSAVKLTATAALQR